MAEANWYWAEGQQRNGPVAASAIARLVADGKLGGDNLIWKEGMADWIPVSKVPALVKHLKKPATAEVSADPATAASVKTVKATPVVVGKVAAATPVDEPLAVESDNDINQLGTDSGGEVGYYNPSAGFPPRAAATLKKHARPRGDVGDWPLDDARVAQFEAALKLRKRIDGAASLFRLLLFLAVLGDVASVAAFAFALMAARGPSVMAAGLGMGAGLAGAVGITVLYYFAWKGTVRSQLWAPLVMGILFLLGGLTYAGMMVAAVSFSSRGTATPLYGVVAFIMLVAGAFAYVAFKAAAAIPKYLRQPAWCQELLSGTSA